jgi:two-component system sensor histidine kinase/response regulator
MRTRPPVDAVQRVVPESQSATPTCHIELIHDGNLRGEWDSDRLTQVTSNLLGNSIQHGAMDQPIRVELDGKQPARVS